MTLRGFWDVEALSQVGERKAVDLSLKYWKVVADATYVKVALHVLLEIYLELVAHYFDAVGVYGQDCGALFYIAAANVEAGAVRIALYGVSLQHARVEKGLLMRAGYRPRRKAHRPP